MSLFGGIETALSGLNAQQALVETATQNVSNADNPDYSRQVVDLTANPAYPAPGMSAVGPGQIGTGVSVVDVRRVTDPFTQNQIWTATAQQGEANVEADTTSQIQSIFNDLASTGIPSLTDKFWSDWQNVANAPADPGARAGLVGDAQNLANTIQQTTSQLTTLQQGLNGQVALQVGTLNTLTSQIAVLNRQIVQVEATGEQPNDLLDQRDALIGQIAGIAQVQVSQQANGAAMVTLSGVPLVDGTSTIALTTTVDANGMNQVTGPNGQIIQPTGGNLAGVEAMRDSQIPSQLGSLNAWAQRLMGAVNALHSGANGNVYNLVNPSTPATLPFFTGTGAADIAVNSQIVQNPSLIAASQTANGPGDGSNALAIGNLQSDPTAGGGSASGPTIDGQYAALSTEIGAAASAAQGNLDNQKLIVQHLQQRQSQLSGVSLDEEAANLITYQRAYEASARALTVFDDMLNKLINDTGIVGR